MGPTDDERPPEAAPEEAAPAEPAEPIPPAPADAEADAAPAEAPGAGRLGVVILLALAAVVGAFLATRASLTASSSSGAWQGAVREEVQRSAVTVENIRYVYVGQGLSAFRVGVHDALADQAEETAAAEPPGPARTALDVEAKAQRLTEQTLADAISGVIGPERRTDRGYDMPRYLATQERQYPDLLALDPDARQRDGDDLSQRALRELSLTILAALAFASGALAQGFERQRRFLLMIGTVLLAAAVVAAVVMRLTQ